MKSCIPNIITSCNLISGCIATLYAFMGKPEWALLFIILGAAFDFCDGLSARALGVSSPIGKELDSLADNITFGFAPAAIVYYELLMQDYPASMGCIAEYIPYLAFLIAAFSALRLAKFNLDTRQSDSFIGLPTPANALFWGSLVVGFGEYIEKIPHAYLLIIALIICSCYILVCELPMFALKFKHKGLKEPGNLFKYSIIVICLATFAIFWITGNPFRTFAPCILAYILVSIIMCCKK